MKKEKDGNDWWHSLKKFLPFRDFNEGQMRIIKVCGILGLTGILFLLLGGLGRTPTTPQVMQEKLTLEQQWEATLAAKEKELARDLVAILAQVQGVGKVHAKVSFDVGPQQVYTYNTREETQVLRERDSGGGEREQESILVEEQVVLIRDAQGNEYPLVTKEVQPKIRGVLIIAEGAESTAIRAALVRAISRGLGVPIHRVVVLPH